MRYSRVVPAALALLVLAGCTGRDTGGIASGSAADSVSFQFALIGDAPYGVPADSPDADFRRVVEEINGEERVRWVLHAGDVMGESTGCAREMYRDRLERLEQLRKPVVMTPGDNDWTDCHRAGSGDWDPVDRLTVLRETFYDEPGRSLGGEPMPLVAQAERPGRDGLPENVRWTRGGVVFATVHVPGSRNGRSDFPGRDADDSTSVRRRTGAGLSWLEATFDRAEEIDARGVFVLIHANPMRGHPRRPGKTDPAYRPFLEALERRTRRFGEPVVLAHGDSHYFRVDKPILPRADTSSGRADGSRLDNLTRVESFGEPLVHWVRITVEPARPELFSFDQEIVPGE